MSMNEMESKIRELRQLEQLIDEAAADAFIAATYPGAETVKTEHAETGN